MSNLSLAPEDENSLSAALAQLDETEPAATVVLIGSAARSRMTWRSDIDLMVVTPQPIGRLHSSPRIHVHYETRPKFVVRLEEGDEFALSAVLHGELLRDPGGWWQQVLRRDPKWPDWRQKLPHIAKRLRTAEVAIKDGDCEAAEEELMIAASHSGRAILLMGRQFPLSRPELPAQLGAIGRGDLGDLLSRLMQGGSKPDDLKRAFTEVKRLYQGLRLRAAASRGSDLRNRFDNPIKRVGGLTPNDERGSAGRRKANSNGAE